MNSIPGDFSIEFRKFFVRYFDVLIKAYRSIIARRYLIIYEYFNFFHLYGCNPKGGVGKWTDFTNE